MNRWALLGEYQEQVVFQKSIGFTQTAFDSIAACRLLDCPFADYKHHLQLRFWFAWRVDLIQNFQGKYLNCFPLFEQLIYVVFEPQDFAFFQRGSSGHARRPFPIFRHQPLTLLRGSSLTVSLYRPFLRRAAKTLRPLLVAMRSLNPCLLRRLRFDG